MTAKTTGVLNALFGDLDDTTRRRFGLSTAGEPAPVARDPVPNVGLRDLDKGDYVVIAKAVFGQIATDRVTAVAGGITFFGLLSLFPALTALVSIYGLVADPATIAGHLDLLDSFLPQGALDIIRDQVQAIMSSPGTALSLAGIGGLLVAFYSANGGMKALLSALNVAFFQTETRGFVRLNIVSMAFTLGGLILIVLMLGVIAVIPILLEMLPLADTTSTWVAVIRWPIMFAVLILALAALYRWGPDAPDSRWRWISPGAVLAAVGLVITSILFSWYAANFADYNETYGSIGAVIALMMWLWFASTVVLVGAEVNSEIERHLKRLAGVPAPDDASKEQV
ncbi:YihY/virulence factor BrkB family protein [Paracoccus sediminis]|uniref:Membrane protein n=1 Tax=Paracoccus sediminis TaxID=1214787 RepID=A0A238XBV2_9RHOB|nr:YihY/virulence factor BrkB family protein [Paracoccus sediminis]TBN49596.1 YihY/virulence factor BrkB family protein [Paracoccus sediminis]SNR56048.1 membrane protein [Paracoccus sediminis]